MPELHPQKLWFSSQGWEPGAWASLATSRGSWGGSHRCRYSQDGEAAPSWELAGLKGEIETVEWPWDWRLENWGLEPLQSVSGLLIWEMNFSSLWIPPSHSHSHLLIELRPICFPAAQVGASRGLLPLNPGALRIQWWVILYTGTPPPPPSPPPPALSAVRIGEKGCDEYSKYLLQTL